MLYHTKYRPLHCQTKTNSIMDNKTMYSLIKTSPFSVVFFNKENEPFGFIRLESRPLLHDLVDYAKRKESSYFMILKYGEYQFTTTVRYDK